MNLCSIPPSEPRNWRVSFASPRRTVPPPACPTGRRKGAVPQAGRGPGTVARQLSGLKPHRPPPACASNPPRPERGVGRGSGGEGGGGPVHEQPLPPMPGARRLVGPLGCRGRVKAPTQAGEALQGSHWACILRCGSPSPALCLTPMQGIPGQACHVSPLRPDADMSQQMAVVCNNPST